MNQTEKIREAAHQIAAEGGQITAGEVVIVHAETYPNDKPLERSDVSPRLNSMKDLRKVTRGVFEFEETPEEMDRRIDLEVVPPTVEEMEQQDEVRLIVHAEMNRVEYVINRLVELNIVEPDMIEAIETEFEVVQTVNRMAL